jgi:hypothetical protein
MLLTFLFAQKSKQKKAATAKTNPEILKSQVILSMFSG